VRTAAVALAVTLFTVTALTVSGRRHVPSMPLPTPAPREAAIGVDDLPNPSWVTITIHVKPRVDLFGNELADAVATYKLDTTGILSPEHARYAVPRLKPPIA
jgi:hypothetical protein